MFNRLKYIVLGVILMMAGTALAAPVAQNFTNIQPFVTNTYDNGTSTLQWLGFWAQNASTTNLSATVICISTDCRTTWPTGATFGTTSISAIYPISWNTATAVLSFLGLSTSTPAVVGNIPYFTGVNTFGNVATTSVTCSGTASCTGFTVVGNSPITITGTGATFSYLFPSNATTTTLTFTGGLVNNATSTGSQGFNLSGGCFAIGGVCVGSGGSTLTGTMGQVAYFSGTNNAVGTSTIWIIPQQYVGIGTSTPYSKTEIWGPDTSANTSAFQVANNASTTEFSVDDSGNVYGNTSLSMGAPITNTNRYFSATQSLLYFNCNAGDVGLGTRSPDTCLTVNGSQDLLTNILSSNQLPNTDVIVGYTYSNKNFFYVDTTDTAIVATPMTNTNNDNFSPSNADLAYAKDQIIVNNTSYIVASTTSNSDIIGYDVTNPIDGLGDPLFTFTDNTNMHGPQQVFNSGKYLFINNANNSITVYDIASTTPIYITNFGYAGSFTSNATSTCDMYLQNIICGNEDSAGHVDFDVMSIANPMAIADQGTTNLKFSTGSNFTSLSVDDQTIYATDPVNGVDSFDMSDPANIVKKAHTLTGFSHPIKIIAKGYFQYVLDAGLKEIMQVHISGNTVNILSSPSVSFTPSNFAIFPGFFAVNGTGSGGQFEQGTFTGIYLSSLSTGNTDIASLDVTKSAQFAGTVQINNGLSVTGSANIKGGININGEMRTTGTGASVSSCGTNPSISGNDTAGTVTVGSGIAVLACTVTFGTAKIGTPVPIVNVDGATAIATSISASSNTAFTVTFASALGSGTFNYFVPTY